MATVSKKKIISKIAKALIAKPKRVKEIKSKKDKLPAWEIALSVINPVKYHGYNRPRRTSLHTLATIVGAKDPLILAKEMRKSRKVLGYVCPDVQTPIFYLKRLAKLPGMIDTRDSTVWGKWRYPEAGAVSLADFVEKNPYPKIKGFKRFVGSNGYWTGGSYGRGKYVIEVKSSGMEKPYEPADYDYARAVIKALKAAGYKPGITEMDLK